MRGEVPVRGYPALLDDGASVSIRVFTTPDLQAKVMRNGVRRLMLLATPVSKRALERDLTDAARLAVARHGSPAIEQLADDALTAAADRVIADFGALPFTATDFDALVAAAHEHHADRAATALRDACLVVAAANAVNERLSRLVAPAVGAGAEDARQQLGRLVRPGFVTAAGVGRLADLLRYVKGIDVRLNKLPENPGRDATTLRAIVAVEKRYIALLRRLDHDEITPDVIELGWLFEELRVSLFAQQLGTTRSVSIQRATKELTALGG
jgi:ATP-dependent helicase HrpA